MKKQWLLFLIMGLFALSCGYDNPGSITDVILTDEPTSYNSDSNLSLRQVQVFNTSGFSYASFNSLLGFDVYVTNNSNQTYTEVTIEIIDTVPSGFSRDPDNALIQYPRAIGDLFPGQERSPDFSWTFGLNRLGNFYIYTPEQSSGITSIEIRYKISYNTPLDGYQEVEIRKKIDLN